jgi:putative transposase
MIRSQTNRELLWERPEGRDTGDSNKPQSSALRRGRFSEKGRAYHITVCRADRIADLANRDAYTSIRDVLKFVEEQGHIELYAFIVMPDHVHMLFTLSGEWELSKAVGRIKQKSALAINTTRRTTGSFWQNGFHDHALRRDEDLQQTARYILENPVRAGLVSRLDEYKYLWSKWHV